MGIGLRECSLGWKNLRSKYEEKTGLKQTKKQLKNKLENMKKEYTSFMELKNSATSLGWNEAKQTVDSSKEWRDEHLVVSSIPSLSIIHLLMFIWADLLFLCNFRDATMLIKVSNATM